MLWGAPEHRLKGAIVSLDAVDDDDDDDQYNCIAFKWLTTPELCDYTTVWKTITQNSGWTLQLLSCVLVR